MSNNQYNRKFMDFIAIPLTSNPKIRDHSIQITSREMSSGSLPVTSFAKVDKIFSLEQSLVRMTIGQLSQSAFNDIRSELMVLLS